ncbi:primosomal protein N' [Arenicella xantha]|uniref:Replication restart protein PriA n=1 Tax=Arenicella xantha TaxID=644221 RepID=A0A395JFI3_9GAMM|nr:primosomal protein N' [Arenicella xantha]RBP47090.1 replication restart DNA helicase PriA [Arenicella xantha]
MTLLQNTDKSSAIICVAVPVPLRQTFDFLAPQTGIQPQRGARIKVPFGSRTLIGIIVAVKQDSEYPIARLKTALEVLDTEAVFDEPLWSTLEWLARYYLAPIGEVLALAQPVLLRQGEALSPTSIKTWSLTDHGRSSAIEELNRAPLQLAIVKRFMRHTSLSPSDFKDESASWRQAISALVSKGWVEEYAAQPRLVVSRVEPAAELQLNPEQAAAAKSFVTAVAAREFACHLLHGVTGSGKTEVYFAAIQAALDQQQQTLLMVPEIGLTPQLIERVERRFQVPVVTMHSNLNDRERHLAWWHARTGEAKIIIGTRSAMFSPFANLGLIVVDEEHDNSFKQQDGVRYHARDMAIYRAKTHGIPIVLGSATPSLESYANALSGRYQLHTLGHRATSAELPKIQLVDLAHQPSNDGLSPAMLEAIKITLAAKKQVMLFLNRRGYAPVLFCSSCKQACKCHRCDSYLTLHRRAYKMRCHHCGYEGRIPELCGHCGAKELVDVGDGTQRVEDALALRFPEARLLRIDRDSTRRKGELAEMLELARAGEVDIIVGTQLITKGHDFPDIALVGVLEVDQSLYSTDFRATENLFQQLLQVAGRAGRREQVGQVLIQTRFTEHPIFETIRQHDFSAFAGQLLAEREAAGFPPFGYFALLRAESPHQAQALQFLRKAKQDLQPCAGVMVFDAIPAPMERRAGRYRAQLLITAEQRSGLNATLATWLDFLAHDTEAKKRANAVRWSLDIDPQDFF